MTATSALLQNFYLDPLWGSGETPGRKRTPGPATAIIIYLVQSMSSYVGYSDWSTTLFQKSVELNTEVRRIIGEICKLIFEFQLIMITRIYRENYVDISIFKGAITKNWKSHFYVLCVLFKSFKVVWTSNLFLWFIWYNILFSLMYSV